MGTFREALGFAMGELACAGARSVGELLYGSTVPLGIIEQYLVKKVAYNTERLFCNNDPYTTPFKPGLCDFLYNVVATYRISGHPDPQYNRTLQLAFQAWGPIGPVTYLREEVDSPGGRQIFRLVTNTHGVGTPQRLVGFVQDIFGQGEFHEKATLVVLNVESTPADGASDPNCGGVYTPTPYDPKDHTYSVTINYTAGDNTNVTIPLIGVLGIGVLNVNGQVNIPVKFSLNPTANLNIDFPFEINGSINLDTGDTTIDYSPDTNPLPPTSPPSSPPSPPSTKPTAPAPPKPPGIPDAAPDPEDEQADRIIVGAIVTTTQLGSPIRQTVIAQSGAPNIFAPNLGFLSFAIEVGDGAVGWTNDIAVKNLRAYVPCPVDTGAVSVRGTAAPGNQWTVTPVYRPKPALVGGG